MTRAEALALLGLHPQATADDISRAITDEYRLWQGRTNAVDIEVQTETRRRMRDLGEAERLLLGDRRTRAHQPAPSPPADGGPDGSSHSAWPAPQGPQGPPAPRGTSWPAPTHQHGPRSGANWPPPNRGVPQRDGPAWGGAPAPPPPPPLVAVGDPIAAATRMGAKLLDIVLVQIVAVLVLDSIAPLSFLNGLGNVGADLVVSMVTVVLYLAYFAGLEAATGWTLGKKMLKIAVFDAKGHLPELQETLKRNSWMIVLVIPVVGPWLWLGVAVYLGVTIGNSPSRQGWHDLFAGRTSVLKTA